MASPSRRSPAAKAGGSPSASGAGFVERMQAAHDEGDVTRFVEADLAFHATIFEAVDNVFVDAFFEPLEQVVRRLRAETSAVPDIRVHAISWHTAILETLIEGDAAGARESMRGHLFQTEDDMDAYLANSERSNARRPPPDLASEGLRPAIADDEWKTLSPV